MNSKKTDLKKIAVFAGMGLLFAGAMNLIFAPSSKTKEEQNRGMGLNTEIPAPAQSEMADDKRTAYEQEFARQMQEQRMRTLEDFTALVNVDSRDDGLFLIDDKSAPVAGNASSSGRATTTQSSVDAYREMNRTLGSFYEQPKENNREKEMREEIELLKSRLENQQPERSTMEEQLELMERSYQMAARYMQGTAGAAGLTEAAGTIETMESSNPVTNDNASKRIGAVPVTGVHEQVVSALHQYIGAAEFVETYGRERNTGFYSPETNSQTAVKNTIRACIHDNQTVSDGLETQRSVRIRLTEPMTAGGMAIPANTILTGQARIGERLDIAITSFEYQ